MVVLDTSSFSLPCHTTNAPTELLPLVSNLCENQQAVITSTQWETKPANLPVRVFQGDPLSVSIFNTTINLLLDHIQTVCPDTGYCFSSSARELPILQYADDTYLIAKNAKKCQQMLHATEEWLDWAGRKPKVSKCRALGLQSRTARTSRFFNPQLPLCSEEIPFLDNDTILFLGMPATSIMSTTGHQKSLSAKLLNLLN